ncbi:hypothetical protein G4228_015614, partial [Cervus hanglu yarkandensis]
LPLAETSCHLEMLQGARRTLLNFPSAFLDGNRTQSIGFPFCCLICRLQFPPLLLLGVTCHAVVGSLWRPSLQGNANLLHLSRNRSNPEQGCCERGARLASSLDFWTLSSENFIDISWSTVLPTDPVKEVLEDILDLDLSVSETDDFIQLVSGRKIVFGSTPLAHRYGGHQFGIWSDQFGDGRAHLTAIYMNRDYMMLLDFIIQEYFPLVDGFFFSIVMFETAQLIALWMSVGFAHGVCNTDNFSLLSITMDYGPFGFMEAYNPDFVPNASDDERRYKIGNQANIGMFNLNKLLQVLNPLLNPRQKQLATQILKEYPIPYYTRFRELFKVKLGLLGKSEGDDDLIAFLLHLMEKTEADFTMTFRQLSEITQSQLQELVIPQVHLLQQVLRHPFQKHSAAERAGYSSPTPSWARDLRVSCSS